MMFSMKQLGQLAAAAILLLVLSGCGDSTEQGQLALTCNVPQIPDATGAMCIDPPPIQCPAPTVPDAMNESCVVGADPDAPEPVIFAGEDQAVLFYNRPQDGNYDGWRLHTWNNDSCDAYQPESLAPSWDNGLPITGIDPNYGAYWVLELKEGYAGTEDACGNFIIHIGTEESGKEMGGGDFTMPLSQDDPDFARMNWTFSGVASVFEYPLLSLGVSVQGAAAHWIDQHTLIWNADVWSANRVRLFYDADGDIQVMDDDLTGQSIELMPVDLTDEQRALVPHLADQPVFMLDLDTAEAKAMVRNQLVLAAYNAEQELLTATYVQAAKVLDDLYAQGEHSALSAQLGIHYEAGEVTAAVWAPTAHEVRLQVYDGAKNLTDSVLMDWHDDTGVWSYTGSREALDRQFYRYQVTAYHPLTREVEVMEATDPYSLNVSLNGRFSQFVDLHDDDMKPDGWDERVVPVVEHPEDIVIYEGHIRDFSIRDDSTRAGWRGKYLAFTEEDSAPVQHLRRLAQAGLTHFHVLPATDQANINEDISQRVEITDTVGRLCQLNPEAPVCGIESNNATIISVLESYLPYESKAQALVQSLRHLDGFNWGYDPHHFIAAEGSYATTPEGPARVLEVRAMIQALNEMGLRVALDVVYNHTSSSGLFDNSVFDKIVPGYYHRYNESTGTIERSTCCENTATEHRMMDKFIRDSMVILARDFGYNDFRFDIMGHHRKEDILAAREAVRAVDPHTYFYGEGWNFGEVANNRLFTQAKQQDMAGSGIGTFNDRIREGVRSAALFKPELSDSDLSEMDIIRISLTATLKDYVLLNARGVSGPASSLSWNGQPAGYAEKPADIINYVSKHDNETLWDILQARLPESMSPAERVRAQNMSIAIPLMSQGIPFLQMGGDFLRSKSMDRDSYDAGDWFNYVDFTMQTNNWAVGLPLAEKNIDNWDQIARLFLNPNTAVEPEQIEFASEVFTEFLQIRSQHPLFRLRTAEDVMARVGFHNVGSNQTPGLIVMSIDDGIGHADLDPEVDALVVVINGTATEQAHSIPTASGFDLHPVQQASVDHRVASAMFYQGDGEGTFVVPAQTMAVFVKAQHGDQGEGLAADATIGAPDIPPYEATSVFVRGGMNGWSTDDEMAYAGAGIYSIIVDLQAGQYEFKIASEDWSTVDFGGGADGQDVLLDTPNTLARSGGNLNIDIAVSGRYVFSLDARNTEAPVLTVAEQQPYANTIYLRGEMSDWGTGVPFSYIGNDQYSVTIALEARGYNFKFADADWGAINYGAGDDGGTVNLGEAKTLAYNGGDLNISIPADGDYTFVVDATEPEAPTITVLADD
ncbi:MAG: DUF3372 domain-containing protein [Alkalimonas sp.]|nr:DUF3372 domain-containing protein [Alkalimonas sp.]